MPVSHSEKMEASVLGCRLNEKTEHLPIKKRRFLFRDSPPPPPPPKTASSSMVADLHQSSNIDNKADEEKLVKASENENIDQAACKNNTADGEGSGIVSHDMKNLEPVATLEYKANSVKLENMSVKETDSRISPTFSKNVDFCTMDHSSLDKATVDESTLDNSCSKVSSESECSRLNQVTDKAQNSADLDDRLNWDLNTVMTAWEEPLESEGKTSKIKSEIAAENIENEVLPNLTPKIEESELEECKSSIKLLSDVPVPVPSTHTLEYPVCAVSTEHVNVNNKVTGGLSHPMTAGAWFSLDYNVPPIVDPYISIQAYEENVASSKIAGNHAISSGTVQATENDKLKLSLVTAGSLENGDEDNKSKVKRVITYSRITMENLIGKGTENVFSPKSGNNVENSITTVQITENQKLNLSLATANSPENGVKVHQSEEDTFDEDDKAKVKRVISTNQAAEDKDQPDAVCSKHDVACSDADVAITAGKLPFSSTKLEYPNDVASCNKEVFDHENFQTGSEVEDGEFRESSIQTWEGNDEEKKENRVAFITHENASISAPESSSRIRSTEIGSQKGTDEISSVLLPEKLENSDQVSGSEPKETGNDITEVNMKDASQSDQWKMNVSGSEILPENQSSTSNISNIKDLRNIKYSSRIGKLCLETEDVETKADGSRLYRREPASRVGRFRLHGSSSNNADDSPPRSIRESGVLRSSSTRRAPHIRSPPFAGPSFRHSDDKLTNEINISPNVTRQSFRTRLPPNRDEDDFRARLGLRPSGDTGHNRLVNEGPRGRLLRYGSRNSDGGPRGRYYGPANDEYDEPSMEYPHSLPVRRRCFSGSTSPQRSRTRSPIRSPHFRPDTRIRRLRSPDYGHGFDPNLEASPRWVKYKSRSTTNFDRRSPPPIDFYDSSRKTKPNENYRSGPTRYVDNDGYRHGGFVRRYDMDRPVKHIQYDEEDNYGPVFDSRGNGNPKPYNNGTESRFRDLPRRPRDERENW